MTVPCVRKLILACLMAALPLAAEAVTFTVNLLQDAPDDNPDDAGCSYDSLLDPDQFAVCTLRAAIMQGNATPLNEPVTIMLTPGATYQLTLSGAFDDAALTGDLDILRPMTVRVPEGFDARAVIDANGLDRAFEIRKPSALYGLEIKNGFREDRDAVAIRSTAPGTQLMQLDVHDNVVGDAIGSLACVVSGTFVLLDSRIHHNGTEEAPANGVCGNNLPLTVVQSTIDNNTGDGINAQFNTITVQTSTVSGNQGNGILLFNSSGSVRNATLAQNQAHQLSYGTSLPEMFELTLTGSIVDGSESQDIACRTSNHLFNQSTFKTSWNAYSDLSCFSDILVDNSLHNAAALLSPLGNFGGLALIHAPSAQSVAIDRAPASVCNNFPVDQRGLTRPVSHDGAPMPQCDLGAVELQKGEQQGLFSDGFE